MNDIEVLIDVITRHNFKAENRNGELWGEMIYSTRDGMIHYEWQKIECNINAVRIWLGY